MKAFEFKPKLFTTLRFYDKGNYVYFTTRGDVTSITNDSTAQRTITINKTPYE